MTCLGASHGLLSTKRGDAAFREALLEPGKQFLTKARGSQSSPEHGLVPLASIFDDQNDRINLREIRKFLDWLESVCFQNKFSHFDSAFMALCTLMLAVRAFTESYRLSFHHNLRSPSPSTMTSEIVIQAAVHALEALFGLIKLAATGVPFDPGANIAKWAGPGPETGMYADVVCDRIADCLALQRTTSDIEGSRSKNHQKVISTGPQKPHSSAVESSSILPKVVQVQPGGCA